MSHRNDPPSRPRLAKPVKPENESRRNLVLFEITGQAYALEMDEVQEIVPMAELSQPPGLPALLAGLLNLEGSPVAVIRLSVLMGLPDVTMSLYTPLLILRNQDNRVALLVERVIQTLSVPASEILPIRENHSFNDCATGIIKWQNRTVLIITAERLLLEKERQCLAELEAAEQDRLRQLEDAKP
jgi:purine-binding chemotaxis protein CheW